MIGYLLMVAGVAIAAAGFELERRKGSSGWDKFRLDKLENGRIPPLLEDKIREIAAAEARSAPAACVVCGERGEHLIGCRNGPPIVGHPAEDPKKI